MTNRSHLASFFSFAATTGDFMLQCRVGSCGALFVLDASKRLCNVTVRTQRRKCMNVINYK
jgi:hypothetical protein